MALVSCVWAKIPSSPFYARKAYFDPYPTSDLSVSVQTLKKYHAENRSFKKKQAPTSFCGILGTLLSKTVSTTQLFGSQTVLCKFLFSLTHYIMLVLELHIGCFFLLPFVPFSNLKLQKNSFQPHLVLAFSSLHQYNWHPVVFLLAALYRHCVLITFCFFVWSALYWQLN